MYDLKDKKILVELDTNCRQSNTSIAKKVLLSKDAVGYRIKQFEKKKVVEGYRTLIDVKRLGYTQYRVLFQLVNVNKEKLDKLIQSLKEENIVWGIAINEGEWDLAFTCLTKTDIEFNDFYENLMSSHRTIIKNRVISHILKYHEVGRGYLANKRQQVLKPAINSETVEIDRIDHQILQLLSENARMKLVDMSKRFGLSSMLIHQRIKKLEKQKIIIGYKANINVLRLGRDYYGIKMNLNDYSEKEQILNELYSLKEMTAVIYALGGYDLEFDLEVKDTKEFHEIINNLRNKFSSIREIKYMRAMEYYKLAHFPK